MPWLSSAPLKQQHVPAPVPDIHVLRRRALEASWRRDRWVGRRRVAIRWTLFYARRYGLPGLFLLCIGLFIWLRVVPWLLAPEEAPSQIAAALPAPTPQSGQPVPPAPEALLPASPESDPPLRLERYWGGASARQIYVRPDESPAPQLKPDHWLHSQEP